MQLNHKCLSIVVLLTSLASCNAMHRSGAEREGLAPLKQRWSVSAFHENSEVDEIKINDPGDFTETRKDVDRKRTGVRGTYGIEYAEGYLEVFTSDNLGAGTDSGGGFGLGVLAEIDLCELESGATVFFPYKVGVSFAGGEGTFGGEKADFGTVEVISELGIGLDYRGFRPSIGVTNKSMAGVMEFDVEDSTADEDEIDDIDADYAAGYFELGYRSPSLPMQASVRVLGGDESGVYGSLSIIL